MSQYIREYHSGGYYFFTLVTYKRQPLFADNKHIQYLKSAINNIKQSYPFSLNAMVVLPDHLHCLWKLPNNDFDFSIRWRLIKRMVSMQIDSKINLRGEKRIWQRRFWEHYIRDHEDWRKHMDYIHYNPVNHGLVEKPSDWEHSSFHYWVKKGLYEPDWGLERPLSLGKIKGGE